jgi:hypothetical protein
MQEAKMIEEVDKPGSEITTYIESLEGVLTQHLADINFLQSRLYSFREKLKEEHRLNSICQSQQEQAEGFDSGTDVDFPAQAEHDIGDEPRARMTKVQMNYDYPMPRNTNYNK